MGLASSLIGQMVMISGQAGQVRSLLSWVGWTGGIHGQPSCQLSSIQQKRGPLSRGPADGHQQPGTRQEESTTRRARSCRLASGEEDSWVEVLWMAGCLNC